MNRNKKTEAASPAPPAGRRGGVAKGTTPLPSDELPPGRFSEGCSDFLSTGAEAVNSQKKPMPAKKAARTAGVKKKAKSVSKPCKNAGFALDDAQYGIIEDCGAAEMSVSETCELAGITAAEFYRDVEAVSRYRRGRLQTKLTIRLAVVRMAKNGVPQMAKLYKEFAGGCAEPNKPMDTDAPMYMDDSLDDLPDSGSDGDGGR